MIFSRILENRINSSLKDLFEFLKISLRSDYRRRLNRYMDIWVRLERLIRSKMIDVYLFWCSNWKTTYETDQVQELREIELSPIKSDWCAFDRIGHSIEVRRNSGWMAAEALAGYIGMDTLGDNKKQYEINTYKIRYENQ